MYNFRIVNEIKHEKICIKLYGQVRNMEIIKLEKSLVMWEKREKLHY